MELKRRYQVQIETGSADLGRCHQRSSSQHHSIEWAGHKFQPHAVLAVRGFDSPRYQPVDPRAKNSLRALAMFSSTAGLVERDLFQRYPRHFASGMWNS